MTSIPPAGRALRRSIGRQGPPYWLRPAPLASLPGPWAELLETWRRAFGVDEARLQLRTAAFDGGDAIALARTVFLLDGRHPGMAAELDAIALAFENLAEMQRRDAMACLVGGDVPHACLFVSHACVPRMLEHRGLSADALLLSLRRCPKAWKPWSHPTGTRGNRLLGRLGMKASFSGSRLRVDCEIRPGLWLRDLACGRLQISPELPSTIAAALAGRHLRELIVHPILDVVDAPIRKVASRTGSTAVDFDLPLRPICSPPAELLGWPGTHPDAGIGTVPAWRSDVAIRQRLVTQGRMDLGLAPGRSGAADGALVASSRRRRKPVGTE